MKKFINKAIAILLSAITIVSASVIPATVASAATSVSVKTGTYYVIKNVGSNKYLNVYGSRSANNTNVTIYQKDGTKGEDFLFTKNGNGYTITPRCSTSRRLNVYGTSAKQRANVCIWNATGSSTQRWIIKAVSGGYIICCADNTDYVLTATGSSNSSNVNIQKYTGSKHQVWTCPAFSTSSTGRTSSTATTYKWPCSTNASITGKYGTDRGDHIHAGIDIGLAKNSPIYSTADGVVIAVNTNPKGARGRYVVIYHKSLNVSSLYQHLQSVNVSKGSTVSQGQLIGKAGGSGYGSDSYYKSHLHFELKKGQQTTSNAYNFNPTPNKVIHYINK